jgi:predicted MFS family arabinose efflux permease
VLTVTGLIDIWLLFALTFFLGVTSAFNQPARLALISSLVPKPDLATAVAVNSITVNTARFIGPALAGLLIVTLGVAAAFALNMVSFAAMLWALSHIRIAPDGDGRAAKGPFLRDLAEGVRYSARHPGIATVLVLMVAASVGGRPIMELLPGFAEAVFEAGAPGLAALSSSLGVGAILAGLWLGQRGPTGLTAVLLRSTALLAATIALFTMTENLWLALPAIVAVGFFLGSTGISAQSLVQISVDPAMRGRVLSLYGLIFRGGPAVGALMMGVASEAVGLGWPVFAGALFVALAWAWALRRREAMQRHLE